MSLNRHIAVIGGGLTGLSSAFHLSRRFPDIFITLFEKQHRLGGWVQSECVDVSPSQQMVLEAGPRTIRPNAKSILELVHLLGLKDSLITVPRTAAAARNRFLCIPEHEQIQSLPASLSSLVVSPFRSILLPAILREPFRQANRAHGSQDESFDSFMTRRFGKDLARTLGSALVHGIYAADSRKLSVRAAFPLLWEAEERGWGSVILGLLRSSQEEDLADYEMGDIPRNMNGVSVFSFRNGMSTLTDALKNYLVQQPNVKILSDTPVTSLDVSETKIQINQGMLKPTHVVSTIPLLALKSLLPSLPHLTANPSSSVTLINLVFSVPPNTFHPPGFGYLIPRPQDDYSLSMPGILGVIFDSCSLSSQDTPTTNNSFTKITVMLGGPHPLTEDHTRIPVVISHLEKHLGAKLPDPVLTRTHHHDKCIPTLTLGHVDRISELKEVLRRGVWRGRLEIIGAGVGGVSVADCVDAGKRVGSLW
ncbi:Protoporphyrinogen oxidase [Guyanagaster necrorhizus]|uniref:Protoporphyrinogen oxidase n=1 Tax=Guyanagaster necrorhizus TaxID=856835 RepID=A0A9P7VY34_9AGAR|nr:Protoporphyrinogen oxidase [Guyanagaster necrorhizus MCA 3950]KAG7448718.1 Protoporphyrinogen oxidase [Guyanagaster necrorhizus MCA 3950]